MDNILAKKKEKENWQRTQTLYWQGNPFERLSQEYQELLDRAYTALYKNTKFKKALEASRNAVLTHSIGKSDPRETILTKKDFVHDLQNFVTLEL